MSETNDTRNPQQSSSKEEQLLRDLRAMPRADAPLDFAAQLKRRIEAEALVLPWWRRLFRAPSAGGFQLPSYAYGAAAAAVLVVVSVYVFQTTDVEQALREEVIRQQQVLP